MATNQTLSIGKKYFIIYDDKSNFPKKKIGIVIALNPPLFKLDTDYELLNLNYIIRAEETK